jgi:hypothetical protein
MPAKEAVGGAAVLLATAAMVEKVGLVAMQCPVR